MAPRIASKLITTLIRIKIEKQILISLVPLRGNGFGCYTAQVIMTWVGLILRFMICFQSDTEISRLLPAPDDESLKGHKEWQNFK